MPGVYVWLIIHLHEHSLAQCWYAYLWWRKTLHGLPSCCEQVTPQIVDIRVCTGSVVQQTDEPLDEAKHRRRCVQLDEWMFRGDHEGSSDVRECRPCLPRSGFRTSQKLWSGVRSTKCVEERKCSTSTLAPFLVDRVHVIVFKVFAGTKANPNVNPLELPRQRVEETSQYDNNIGVMCCHKDSSAACGQSMSQVYAHLGISFFVATNCHVGWTIIKQLLHCIWVLFTRICLFYFDSIMTVECQ